MSAIVKYIVKYFEYDRIKFFVQKCIWLFVNWIIFIKKN